LFYCDTTTQGVAPITRPAGIPANTAQPPITALFDVKTELVTGGQQVLLKAPPARFTPGGVSIAAMAGTGKPPTGCISIIGGGGGGPNQPVTTGPAIDMRLSFSGALFTTGATPTLNSTFTKQYTGDVMGYLVMIEVQWQSGQRKGLGPTTHKYRLFADLSQN
jgi:hypothetical protein